MKLFKSGLNRLFRFATVYCIVSSFVLTFSASAFSQKSAENLGSVPPQYLIFDIGVVQTGDSASQGFGVSAGDRAVGRSVRTGGASL